MHECLKNKIHQRGLSQAGIARLIGYRNRLCLDGLMVSRSLHQGFCNFVRLWRGRLPPTNSDLIFILTQQTACLLSFRLAHSQRRELIHENQA